MCKSSLYQTIIYWNFVALKQLIKLTSESKSEIFYSGQIQRTAQDRVIWSRHAEAFTQPRDTMAA